MPHRAFPLVCLALALGVVGALSPAFADDTPEKPNAPKQIDPTPPLVPILNAKVTQDGLLIGGQPSPEQFKAIQEAGDSDQGRAPDVSVVRHDLGLADAHRRHGAVPVHRRHQRLGRTPLYLAVHLMPRGVRDRRRKLERLTKQ